MYNRKTKYRRGFIKFSADDAGKGTSGAAGAQPAPPPPPPSAASSSQASSASTAPQTGGQQSGFPLSTTDLASLGIGAGLGILAGNLLLPSHKRTFTRSAISGVGGGLSAFFLSRLISGETPATAENVIVPIVGAVAGAVATPYVMFSEDDEEAYSRVVGALGGFIAGNLAAPAVGGLLESSGAGGKKEKSEFAQRGGRAVTYGGIGGVVGAGGAQAVGRTMMWKAGPPAQGAQPSRMYSWGKALASKKGTGTAGIAGLALGVVVGALTPPEKTTYE